MIRIYLALVDIVPAAVVLVPLFFVFHFRRYRRNLNRSILSCLFCLYLSAVFALVGIPNVPYVRPDLNLNLIPFRGIWEDGKNSILNVALFIPLGMFLPVLWSRFRQAGAVVLYGLGFSLAIELLQMLTFRATDVNDLITNGVGTLAGFFLVKPVFHRYLAVGKDSREAYLLSTLSFGVMFFVHPFLSPWIWDRLL